MPNTSGKEHGWTLNQSLNRLEFWYLGTRIGSIGASGANERNLSLAVTGSQAVTGSIVAGTSVEAVTTITAGTGLTVTTGNSTNVAGDTRITAGNLRLGVVSAFATTEPTSAAVMKVGTNPVGAITTSGAVFTTTAGATISKIIADGTVSQIEA